jgi:hypothetical protein
MPKTELDGLLVIEVPESDGSLSACGRKNIPKGPRAKSTSP